MKKNIALYLVFLLFISTACGSMQDTSNQLNEDIIGTQKGALKIISLGDSYTIGTSVCDTCKFPEQLASALTANSNKRFTFPLKVIARNGWTTTNLIAAIKSENDITNYDLVTLLIGVNNQFQNKKFSLYEKEFPELIDIAISTVNGNANKLIVLSIPDYAFTPFGGGNTFITSEIKKYNDFAKSYCEKRNITFLNITDITQEGLKKTNYVASDGLHPSEDAYAEFVKRLVPIALQKLGLN